jgi:predicted dehydrogenase
VLARNDIDAILIGTPDHWHKQVSVDPRTGVAALTTALIVMP